MIVICSKQIEEGGIFMTITMTAVGLEKQTACPQSTRKLSFFMEGIMPTGVYDRTKSKPNSSLFKKGHAFIKGGEKGWFKKGIHPATEIKKGQFEGLKHPNWKGGRTKDKDGYILVKKRTHLFCNPSGYVREHRLVIEKQIGRYLLLAEKCHHLGAKDDNRPHMLMAFTSHSAHMRFERGGKIKLSEIIFDGKNTERNVKMTDITIAPIKTDNVEVAVQESNKALAAIQAVDIKDQASYESVANIRKTVNAKIKELDKERKEITSPIDIAKSKIMELFKRPATICKEVISICDNKMIRYTDEQERIRRAEQEKLEHQAEAARRKKEEEERVWKEKEEAKRKEEERLEAEGNAAAAQKARAEADKAEAKAEEKQEKAAEIMAPVAAPRVEKAQGVHYTERFYGEVTDFSILSDDYKMADTSKINKVCQVTKGSLPILGVKVLSKRIVNSRG